ncbi:hypothetical protein ACRRTK_015386 [Alexandromys fortis]
MAPWAERSVQELLQGTNSEGSRTGPNRVGAEAWEARGPQEDPGNLDPGHLGTSGVLGQPSLVLTPDLALYLRIGLLSQGEAMTIRITVMALQLTHGNTTGLVTWRRRGLPASHPVAGRARANTRAPSWAVGDALLAAGCPKREIPGEVVVVMFPVVVIVRGVPTSRFPILELALATGGEANTRSLECSMALQPPPPPPARAQLESGTPGQAASLENRRRWARRAQGAGLAEQGLDFHLGSDVGQQGDLGPWLPLCLSS